MEMDRTKSPPVRRMEPGVMDLRAGDLFSARRVL